MTTIASGVRPLGSEAIRDYRVFKAKDMHFHYTVGMHYHEHYEIYLHERGGTRMVVGQSSYVMSPCELYIIPPFFIHGIVTDAPLTDYSRSWVHITPAYLSGLGGPEISFSRVLDSLTDSGDGRFFPSRTDFARLTRMLEAVPNLSADASPYDRLSARLSLAGFFNELCRLLMENGSSRASNAGDEPIIHQVFNYISENCTEDLSLDFLADHFNLSKYYLSHMFAREYNVSTYRYILLCRVARAQQLIRRRDLSLTEIAQQCGFNDYSNFLRSFRQIVGVSPSTYRTRP